MTLNIHRVVIAVGKIPPFGIVNVAVIIVIKAIYCLTGVRPDITHQIRMVIIHPSINYPNHQVRITRFNIPGFRGINIGIDSATILSSIV